MAKKKKTEEEIYHDLITGSTREVLKTSQGKEVIWHILGFCGLYDDAEGDYARGKRAVGLDILQLLEDTDVYAFINLQRYHVRSLNLETTGGTNARNNNRDDGDSGDSRNSGHPDDSGIYRDTRVSDD